MAQTDFTISDVLAWARTKPAGESYNYSSVDNCALCQFFRDRDVGFRAVGGTSWTDQHGRTLDMPEGLADELIGMGDYRGFETSSERWTFGRLVERLEKLCPEAPIVTASDWARLDAYMIDIELALS